MTFLKKWSEHSAQGGLKLAIHRRMPSFEPARSTAIVHASEAVAPGFCSREYALLDITGKAQAGSFIGTSLRYTYDLGRAMEHELQNRWALPFAHGIWECPVCLADSHFGPKPETPCPNCLAYLWDYREMRFESQISHISCGVDLLVQLPTEAKLRVVEAKSIDKDLWIDQEAPLAEHRLRTNFYLRLIEESGSPYADLINLDEGIVFYMMKGFGKKDAEIAKHKIRDANFSPFKEFKIKRDDKQTEKATQSGVLIKDFRAGGVVPKGVCPTATCKRAKQCTVKAACFSGKYPAMSKVQNNGS